MENICHLAFVCTNSCTYEHTQLKTNLTYVSRCMHTYTHINQTDCIVVMIFTKGYLPKVRDVEDAYCCLATIIPQKMFCFSFCYSSLSPPLPVSFTHPTFLLRPPPQAPHLASFHPIPTAFVSECGSVESPHNQRG